MFPANKYPVGWLIPVSVCLAILWVSAEVRLRSVHLRLEKLWIVDFTIKVVDAGTGKPIPPMIGLPVEREGLPLCYSKDASEDSRRFTVASDRPTYFHILSEGYTDRWITVDSGSPSEIVVGLSKK